jgi:hypothetical protein
MKQQQQQQQQQRPMIGPRSIKFTVRTKGQNDDRPIELEIEIKDQVGFYCSVWTTLRNYLSLNQALLKPLHQNVTS